MHDDLVTRLREEAECPDNYPEDSNLMREAADAIEELSKWYKIMAEAYEAEVTRRDWIPVTERVLTGADKSGELCENVWLFFDDGNVYPGWMNGITEKVYYLDNYNSSLRTAPIGRVKMWQPRPEPPKEET